MSAIKFDGLLGIPADSFAPGEKSEAKLPGLSLFIIEQDLHLLCFILTFNNPDHPFHSISHSCPAYSRGLRLFSMSSTTRKQKEPMEILHLTMGSGFSNTYDRWPLTYMILSLILIIMLKYYLICRTLVNPFLGNVQALIPLRRIAYHSRFRKGLAMISPSTKRTVRSVSSSSIPSRTRSHILSVAISTPLLMQHRMLILLVAADDTPQHS